MIQKVAIELPECPYHGAETGKARKAAQTAVDSVNTLIADFNEQAKALLQNDPAGIESKLLFSGDGRAKHFEILQSELQARRQVAAFQKSHWRDSQNVLQDDAAPSEHRAVANSEVVCESFRLNTNRLAALEARLRGIVERYLAV